MTMWDWTKWLLVALRQRWLVALLVAFAVLAGAVACIFLQPSKYTATADFTLGPKGEQPVSAQVIMVTAPRYTTLVTAPATLESIAAEIGVSATELATGVVATVAPATANLTITVTLGNARGAAAVARALTAVVVAYAEADPIMAAQSLTPNPVAKPAPSNTTALLSASVLVSTVAGIAAAAFAHRRTRQTPARANAPEPPTQRTPRSTTRPLRTDKPTPQTQPARKLG